MYDEKKGRGHFGFRLSTGLKADGLALPRRSASASPPDRTAAGASLRRGGLGPSGFDEASLGATGGRWGSSRSSGLEQRGFAGWFLSFAEMAAEETPRQASRLQGPRRKEGADASASAKKSAQSV